MCNLRRTRKKKLSAWWWWVEECAFMLFYRFFLFLSLTFFHSKTLHWLHLKQSILLSMVKKILCVENDKKNSMWHHEELRDDTELCKKKKSCWLKGKWKLGTHRERVENLLRNHFRIESIWRHWNVAHIPLVPWVHKDFLNFSLHSNQFKILAARKYFLSLSRHTLLNRPWLIPAEIYCFRKAKIALA